MGSRFSARGSWATAMIVASFISLAPGTAASHVGIFAPTAPRSEVADPKTATAEPPTSRASTPATTPVRPVPERLPILQQAGWWTVFSAVALGTLAGLFAGLAEREEDKAVRLASRLDPNTGAQPLYADEQSEYEQILDRGQAYEKTAIGLGVVGGAALVAAAVIFIVDATRRAHGSRRANVHPLRLEVRF